MHKIAPFIAGLLSLLLLMEAASASPLMLEPGRSDYAFNEYFDYLEDPEGTLTIDEVSSGAYNHRFRSLKQHGNQGVTRSVIWLRARIDHHQVQQTRWQLQFDYCPIEWLTLYALYPDGTREKQSSGNLVQPEKRPLPGRHFSFPLNLKPTADQQVELYLRVATKGPVIINTSLMKPEASQHTTNRENRILGIIYGVLLAMILYNSFLYISIRDRNYLHYVAYISAATWALASHDGTYQELVAPYSLWLSHNGIYFSICAAACLGSLFVRGFLDLESHAPRLNRWLQALQWLALAALPWVFLVDNYVLTYIATGLVAMFGLCALLAGIICTRQRSRTGRYFLLAWSLLILGLFLSCLRYMGVMLESPIAHYFIHMGELAEVMLLSFALADRINQMREEKQQIQKEAHEKLRETNIKLEKSMLLQRNFLTAVSHELRTPMNGIVGATDLLSDSDCDEDKIQYVNDIYRSSRKMMSLVENILDFTDVESGEFRPFIKDFTLSEMLEPIVIQFKGKAHRKQLDFQFRLEPDDPLLLNRIYRNDPRIIQKILNQLLGNALKFTSQGEIRITARLTSADSAVGHDQLAVTVKDTGIGMSPETLKDIFIAFQQGDGSFKRQYEGLGIGLSLARALTDKLQGKLEVESRVGQGTAFTLRLQLENTGQQRAIPGEEMPHALNTRTTPTPPRNKQILLVEDNPVNLKVLTKMVEKQGYSTLSADNGAKAVELLKEYRVDLILMDCQMPVMDGFEATRSIRQLTNGNQLVPIVAVTANTMSEDEARCYDCGMNGFVPKPINQKTVQGLLQRWLGQQNTDNDAGYSPAKHL